MRHGRARADTHALKRYTCHAYPESYFRVGVKEEYCLKINLLIQYLYSEQVIYIKERRVNEQLHNIYFDSLSVQLHLRIHYHSDGTELMQTLWAVRPT